MNKKLILPLVVIGSFLLILAISIIQYRLNRPSLLETIPFIRRSPTTAVTPQPTMAITPGVPQQTNVEKAIMGIPNDVSFDEKDKLVDSLPIRVNNFVASNSRKTSINVYSFSYDPISVLRIEIYGPNYNNLDTNGADAIAFRDSFLEVKRLIAPYNVNLKNLQIIFGNRQYIQDTAVYWAKSLNLL